MHEKEISMWLLMLLLIFTGCERTVLCYDHPHGNLSVLMDWRLLPSGLTKPESVKISFYDLFTSREYTYYRDGNGGKVAVRGGTYDMYVHNSDTEMMEFKGTNSFETAGAYLLERARTPSKNFPKDAEGNGVNYKHDGTANQLTRNEKFVTQPDPVFASFNDRVQLESEEIKAMDTLYVTPINRVMVIRFVAKIEGLKYARQCRTTLSGVARSMKLSTGLPDLTQPATMMFDMDRPDSVTCSKTMRALGVVPPVTVNSHNDRVQHILVLEFGLINNDVVEFEFDVESQINYDSIGYGKELLITVDGIKLPEVKPSGGGGGFDASHGDWGDVVEIPIDGTIPN